MQTSISKRLKRTVIPSAILGAALFAHPWGTAAAGPTIVGMGDSIGEGVQAADAAWQTQAFSYLHLVGFRIGGGMTLPFIRTNLFGMVGDVNGRMRVFPDDIATNVAVSGATVNSLLNRRADAIEVGTIDTETDLVLFPRLQSQIEYVESAIPEMVICWIGNNDALSAAISFGAMNASQLTPLAEFERDYISLVDRLSALTENHGTKVVLANIPDVTNIGFLVDRNTAESILGFPVALPDEHYTSIVAVILMRIMGEGTLVSNPDFVLDPNELNTIKIRIQDFNAIIQREADEKGIPVVDINAWFAELTVNPPIFLGFFPLTKELSRGIFSLDGVHPSNIGQALIANEFIKTINDAFGMNVPEFDQNILDALFISDPSIDKDGDGMATGRLGVGLLETLAFLFGFTGDVDDLTPN